MRHHAAKLLSKKEWTPSDFAEPLDGLADEMVSIDAYVQAVNHGRRAVPGVHRDDKDPVVEIWVDEKKKYAENVPGRIAEQLANAANDADKPGASVQDILDRLDLKLEAQRRSVTRYAQPPWGAGWNGYGAQLEQRNIKMEWDVESDNPCPDCISLNEGGPYEHLPTWPGMGSTYCLDACQCEVAADPESWDEAMGESDSDAD